MNKDGGSHLIKWEAVLKLMEFGALGIDNLRVCNEVFFWQNGGEISFK